MAILLRDAKRQPRGPRRAMRDGVGMGATENSRPSAIAGPARLMRQSPSQKAGVAALSDNRRSSGVDGAPSGRSASLFPCPGRDAGAQESTHVLRSDLAAQRRPQPVDMKASQIFIESPHRGDRTTPQSRPAAPVRSGVSSRNRQRDHCRGRYRGGEMRGRERCDHVEMIKSSDALFIGYCARLRHPGLGDQLSPIRLDTLPLHRRAPLSLPSH
jgi:hypothetical protein